VIIQQSKRRKLTVTKKKMSLSKVNTFTSIFLKLLLVKIKNTLRDLTIFGLEKIENPNSKITGLAVHDAVVGGPKHTFMHSNIAIAPIFMTIIKIGELRLRC